MGIGALPDAAAYRDDGSNTVGNIARQHGLRVPTLRSLGLGHLVDLGMPDPPADPAGARAKMAEASPGKDSVTGHWELMGLVLDEAFPVFPNGFPPEIMGEFKISMTQMGGVMSGAMLVGTFLYPLWGYLFDRYARSKLLALASLIWGSTTWLSAIAPTYPLFVATRASTGVDDSSYPGYTWVEYADPAVIERRDLAEFVMRHYRAGGG